MGEEKRGVGEQLGEVIIEMVNSMDQRLHQWVSESAWIYPGDDKKFIECLTKTLKDNGYPNCRVWQLEEHKHEKYPQYLCSADLGGIGGDTIHFWRDGQTSIRPSTGDYTCEDEEKAELILRWVILNFIEEKEKGVDRNNF